jgi:phenylacetate-CoA ligase
MDHRASCTKVRLVGRNWGHRQLYVLPPVSAVFKKRSFWESRAFVPRGLAQRHLLSPDLPFGEVANRLTALKPDVVFSFGSYADLFFRFLDHHGVTIRPPKVWMYGSDMLSQRGRELMERKFGCPVYTTYQAVETSRIGFQCEHRRGLHLNVDLNVLRLVDERGQPVGPGETGEVVVSNLFNRATVLLNYRLGDRAVLRAEPCECGRSLPVLDRLEGRCSEVISLPGGRTVHAVEVEVEFWKELEGALQSQLTQTGPSSVVWRIVPFQDADKEALRGRILGRSRSLLGHDTAVSVEFVTEIPRTPGGKHIRAVPLDTA